jgi:hypothetical protein
MKNMIFAVLLASLLFIPALRAAQQPAQAPPAATKANAPALTDAEKVEILKIEKQQSDLFGQEQQLQAQVQARYQQLEQQRTATAAALDAKIAEVQKRLGPDWTINRDTLEVSKVEAPKPTEKK